MAAGLTEGTAGLGAVGGYKDLAKYTTLGGTLFVFGLPSQQRTDAAVVTITKPVNAQNLVLKGVELTWQQPLDFVLHGLGFSANGTHITQRSDSRLFAPGVAPYSYNVQGYYENYGVSLSVNYVWTDKNVALNPPQNNLPVGLIADKRGQLDLSLGYQLPYFSNSFRVTLDALNLTNAPIRTIFGYANAPYSVYYPGREVLLGVRATF